MKSSNRLFDFLRDLEEVPCGLPSSAALSSALGVSRTTVQKLTGILFEKGLVRQDGTNKIVLRRPVPEDYFSEEDSSVSKSDQVEKLVLRKLSSYELKPGDRFSELELARETGTSTIIMREVLFRISRSGIIRKHPHQKWEVIEFSPDLISEMIDVRRISEDYAIQAIRQLTDADPFWDKLRDLVEKHRRLLKQNRIAHSEVRQIDLDFHMALIEAAHNRFIQDLYHAVFMLITFHIWQIGYDRSKLEYVLGHHLLILELLLAGDFGKAGLEMQVHREYARTNMEYVSRILNGEPLIKDS